MDRPIRMLLNKWLFLGPAILQSKDPLLPFEWYSLEVERRLRDAKMIINGKDVIKGKAPGSTRGLNIRMDIYFGGFDGETVLGQGNLISET